MKSWLLVAAGGALVAAAFARPPHAPNAGGKPIAVQEHASAPAPRPTMELAVVYVVGAVRRPGVYRVRISGRVQAAIAAAGGALPEADLAALNLAEPLGDGQKILVVRRGERSAEETPRERRAAGSRRVGRGTRSGGSHKAPAATPIELNSAGETLLAQLPGIGPGLAQRIVAFRKLNGPFGRLDDLADVAGMTEHRIDAIAPYVTLR